MKKEIWIGKKSLRFFYYRYRDSAYYPLSIAFITIVVCIILVFNVVIPQVMTWLSIRDEVVATQEKIKILQANIDFMKTVDKVVLDSQLQSASMAVPPEKDFGGVLNALTDASVRSGVSLQDFSFQVGGGTSGSKSDTSANIAGVSAVTVSVVVSGKLDQVKRFLRELGEKLPISEVTTIDGNIQSLAVNIQFYQKNLPEIELDEKSPIVRISAKKQALLEKLSTWKPTAQLPDLTPETASGSGEVPLF